MDFDEVSIAKTILWNSDDSICFGWIIKHLFAFHEQSNSLLYYRILAITNYFFGEGRRERGEKRQLR